MELSRKKIIGAVLGVIAGLAVACVLPLAVGDVGLASQGFICLGILLAAIVWWIAEVLPEYVTGFVMVVAFCLFGGVPTEVSFSAFSASTWWLLLAAFALGAGMRESGLMRRMALAILRKFPNSFAARVGGLLAVGTIVGPLIPSLAAKTSMLTPIAMSMGDEAGYARKGKKMQGLFLATMVGIRNIGPTVISASFMGYGILALLPADVQAQFDMLHWLIAALPWFVTVTVLNYVALVLLYGRKGEGEGETETSSHSSEVAQQKTPMSLHEKEMMGIMLVTVALWVTEPFHGIVSHVVALSAMAVMLACGVLKKPDFRKGIAWDSLIFIGTVIGLASVFAYVGIQDWIVGACGPMFQALSGNPYVFVLGIGMSTILLRFVIVSEMAYINIAMVFMVPLAVASGINPWVVGMCIYALVSPWFALYQNSIYLAAFYSVDGQMVNHADMARYCALYLGTCLVGLVVCVPFWQMMGLFG